MLNFYDKNEAKSKRKFASIDSRSTGEAIAKLLKSIQTEISTILTAVNFDDDSDAFVV